MYRDILLSFSAYTQSIYYIAKFKLWKYLILLFLLLLIFIGPILLTDSLLHWLTGFIPLKQTEQYTNMGINVLASISGFVLLLILSPVFSMIAEEVTQQMSGKIYRFSPLQLLKDILRGLQITLRNLVYQYLVIVLIYILLWLLPNWEFLDLTGSVLVFLFTAYFYGFSLLDYAMENHRMNYRQSVDFVRTHPGIAIGLGSILYAMISLNNLPFLQGIMGKISIYWSAFAEAIIAFFGVIAGSVILSKRLLTNNNF